METICKACKESGADQWYPTSVSTLEKIISRRIEGIEKPAFAAAFYSPNHANYGIAKNLAYNLQYIQCLAFQLRALALSDVLYTQTLKTFILHAGAISEAILKHEVGKNFPENSKRFKKLIEKACKEKILGDEPALYEGLDVIRSMRDRIHLHLVGTSNLSDYKYFSSEKYHETKICFKHLLIVYFLLSDNEIMEYFDYLHGRAVVA